MIRNAILVLISLSFIGSFPVSARTVAKKKKADYPKLSQFILPTSKIKKMNSKQQHAYFLFLPAMVSVLETAQMNNYTNKVIRFKPSKKKRSKKKNAFWDLIVPKAYAGGPLLGIIYGIGHVGSKIPWGAVGAFGSRMLSSAKGYFTNTAAKTTTVVRTEPKLLTYQPSAPNLVQQGLNRVSVVTNPGGGALVPAASRVVAESGGRALVPLGQRAVATRGPRALVERGQRAVTRWMPFRNASGGARAAGEKTVNGSSRSTGAFTGSRNAGEEVFVSAKEAQAMAAAAARRAHWQWGLGTAATSAGYMAVAPFLADEEGVVHGVDVAGGGVPPNAQGPGSPGGSQGPSGPGGIDGNNMHLVYGDYQVNGVPVCDPSGWRSPDNSCRELDPTIVSGSSQQGSSLALQAPSGELPIAAPAGNYVKEGAFCIFGGYKSEYVVRPSNGQMYCARPVNQVNRQGCKGTTAQPKFTCNTFGMLSGPDRDEVAKASCVPLFPLGDLTVRCTQSLINWVVKSPPTRLDSEAYDEWRASIVDYIESFERNFTGKNGVSLGDYCHDGENVVNANRQQDECAAIMALLDTLITKGNITKQFVAAHSPNPRTTSNPDGSAGGGVE